jgi:hypothetical protein
MEKVRLPLQIRVDLCMSHALSLILKSLYYLLFGTLASFLFLLAAFAKYRCARKHRETDQRRRPPNEVKFTTFQACPGRGHAV